ncbi:MAG: hypothetical protein QT00_C0001G0530 [archaeon GW2011_AR5]|nr:MAG: hypothetical protein QT00_C0001G0530 [archaeon GW2011_AR5]MBS3051202.1 hypothetical protein [Candidatus Aenigmarchaeota archaeon]
MSDYVTVPVEGDLWDYNAVADIARTIASEFLERFYIGGKREPALQALLNKFMEHIGPDPVNSDYDMRTHSPNDRRVLYSRFQHLAGID